jgi:hypothetical protein
MQILKLFYKRIQSSIEQNTAKGTFKVKKWRTPLNDFQQAMLENKLPQMSTIECISHLFTDDEYDQILKLFHQQNQCLSMSSFVPKAIINLYYARIIDTLAPRRLTKTPLRNYLENELEIHPEDARITAQHVVECYKQNKLPDIEKIILTADFFSNEEVGELLRYANRISTSSVNYTKKESDIDSTIMYAQSKTNRKFKNQPKEIHKDVVLLEHTLDIGLS